MGLIIRDDQALLIDAGLDADAGRRALRVIEGHGAELAAIVVTHAHADHYGGARFLQERVRARLYAPDLEAAMMEHPIIEPLYLFGGAAPIDALRQKFTLAEPCEVTETIGPGPFQVGPFRLDVVPLPGHAMNQIGVGIGADHPVLFCADAVFPQETIDKHKVLFCVDFDQTLDTIKKLPDQPYDSFAPGHGPIYDSTGMRAICEANRHRLEEIRETVYAELAAPQDTPALVQAVARRFSLKIAGPTAYFLTRTPVLSALSSLETTGSIIADTEANKVVWVRA